MSLRGRAVPDANAVARTARNTATTGTPSLAVVGLACRFPDADDPAALLDVVLTGRRSFRRLPPGRIDLADYYQPDHTTSDATYSTRAAVIEGWQFEREAFGIEPAAYFAADPARWLALETTARALAAAGLPAGSGLNLDRTGVIIGNTLAGDTSRANALRVRWPYVRRVLTEALGDQEIPANQAGLVLRTAETSYLAPFPAMGSGSLAGGMPATIATAISAYFGFRGGSHAVDSACSSSLQAVASACAALAAGDLDAAIAGGVDLSLDPLELIGLAKAGVLATTDVRIYDREPTGYLPGEGCGVVVLMRTADARAAELPVYAEILGWGTSGGSVPGEVQSQASTQLLAMRRAYERAAVDPADIQFIEGNGAATSADDAAELSALSTLRSGARQRAALGSIKANIGHAKAAAGAAGLIKTVLALGTGVVPPTTGVHQPHELIAGGDTGLLLPQSPEEWPSGTRLAAISTMGIGGSNVHLVLRHEPPGRQRQDRWLRSAPLLARSTPKQSPEGVQSRLQPEPEPTPFLLHASDTFALAALLTRLADIAASLSDAELQDLACMLGRDPGKQGRARVGLVATRQDQLALLAREAVTLLPHLTNGLITVRPGIFASDDADGRVTLLLSGDASGPGGDVDDAQPGPVALTSGVAQCLDTLRWLESLDVQPTAAVGHGIAALAGLAWAGVLGEAEVVEIADLRAEFLLRSAARAEGSTQPMPSGQAGSSSGDLSGAVELRAAIAQRFRFGPPRRRLISTMTGAEIDSIDDAIDLICSGFAGAQRLTEAVADGAIGATLLVETGPGRILASAAAQVGKVPAISLQSGFTDAENSSSVAAALFAAGALGQPKPLFAGRPARPVDIWRDQVFITNPCQVAPQLPVAADGVPADLPAAEPTVADPAVAEPTVDEPAVAGPTVAETAAAEPAAAEFAAAPVLEHDIASRRDEFERRLPTRSLTDAAPVPDAESAAVVETSAAEVPVPDAESAAVVETSAAEVPVPDAESAAVAETAAADVLVPDADSAATPETSAADTPVPADAAKPAPSGKPGATGKPAIVGKPVVLGQPVVPGKPKVPGEPKLSAAAAPSTLEPPTTAAPYEVAVPASKAQVPVNGLGPWARCFTEGLRPASAPGVPAEPGSWRRHAAGRSAMLADVSSLFAADRAARRTLAILTDPADEKSRAVAIKAARDALETGTLVVLTTNAQFTGFFASLHAEHPSIGVTILRVPSDGVSGDAIRQYASAEAGQFRELVLDPMGLASEPVLAEVAVTGGRDAVLGPDDVILISRSAGGAGLALAHVLACCGAGIAVVGRAGEYDDTELVAGLEQLRSAGARIGYEVIDIADQASLAAAIRRIEDRLGKVTALAYGASTDDPVPVLEMTDAQVRAQLSEEISTLELLASSIRPGQLRLIVSVGTIADRYGLAGSSVHALCSGALASRAGQLAGASAGCQHLHLDMPAWWASGLGDRPELAIELAAADTPALAVETVSRLLLKLMTTGGLPASVALHGRVGGLPATPGPVITRAELSAAGLAQGGRFLREVAVHYPGIELVCSATLSLASDPYLADYRVDGMPVLPPVLALEALAQAASVLAGRPLRRAVNVRLDSPVLIPAGGEALLHVCALRDGNRIVTVLRCADSSYRVDHARAEFSCAPSLPGLPEMPEARFAAASPALQQLVAGPSDLVDGAELYGPISFQSGRFRRIALLPEVTARSGRALARGADEHPWYPVGSELASTEFLLGSPGLNDAALQVLQACVPHRRVRPAACESVQFSGRSIDGPVEFRALAEPIRSVPGDVADVADAVAEAGTTAISAPAPLEVIVLAPADMPEPAFVPGQAGAPEAETTSGSANAGSALPVGRAPGAAAPQDMTAEELADVEVAERRPQARQSRKSRRSRRNEGQGGSEQGRTSYSALHTWEVPAPKPSESTGETTTGNPSGRDDRSPSAAATQARRIKAPAPKNQAVRGGPTYSALHTWEVPVATPSESAAEPATGNSGAQTAQSSPAARRAAQPMPTPPFVSTPVPQLWNIEAVDAAGELVATWRGVQLHDSGPLPRNAAWPPTLLSVFLERRAIDVGLDEGLRVTVSCGQPDDVQLNAGNTVPRQSQPGDERPSKGRHAGPERRAMNTAGAPGTGALAGFGLALRAPVPVACAWTAVESVHRQRELGPGMASAYAQLRAELAEPPAHLSARLDAVSACLAMANLVPADHGANQLAVVRTTGDGWAVFSLGRAHIASAVVEMSGVSAPVAIAILTRRYAHARTPASRVAASVTAS
jgi:enediyne polyketide synthase